MPGPRLGRRAGDSHPRPHAGPGGSRLRDAPARASRTRSAAAEGGRRG